MKNLLVYHVVVTVPILLFVALSSTATTMMLWGMVYAFLFRPIADYYRLKEIGKIEEEDFWRMWKWAGLYRFKYYSALMFGK